MSEIEINKDEEEEIFDEKQADMFSMPSPDHLRIIRAVAEFNAFKWVPMDKVGLPKVGIGQVFVTLAFENKRFVCYGLHTGDQNVNVSLPPDLIEELKDKQVKIIAWMPAPTPYNNVDFIKPKEEKES